MVQSSSPSTPDRVEGLVLNSYAKLNLYLEVLKKRKDGYHQIKTIFERIGLSDRIILKSRRDNKIKITCNLASLACDESNLAYASAKLLKDSLRINRGADIRIIKRIPVGAGLGGGSSNAATVLQGLNALWKLKLTRNELLHYAGKVGCDVPFFIYNTAFAQGSSRGDRIRPLRGLDGVRLWHILVVPGIQVLTPFIYKKWDNIKSFKLTRPKNAVRIITLALRKKDIFLISKALFNDLEAITAGLFPEVKYIKERLVHLGVKSILMSGSGPALFGIVSSRREGQAVERQLKKVNRSWRTFVAGTV